MPNFDFSDEEVERLLTAIMSFQREIQPPAAMPARSARVRLPDAGPDAGAPAQLRRLPHHRRRRRRLREAGRRSVARSADADAGRRARAAGLALRVPARADHDPAVAERPDADLRARRSEPERRHPATSARSRTRSGRSRRTTSWSTRRTIARRGKQLFELLKCQQCHVLGAIPEGSADVEPGARSAHGVRAAAAGLDSASG